MIYGTFLCTYNYSFKEDMGLSREMGYLHSWLVYFRENPSHKKWMIGGSPILRNLDMVIDGLGLWEDFFFGWDGFVGGFGVGELELEMVLDGCGWILIVSNGLL